MAGDSTDEIQLGPHSDNSAFVIIILFGERRFPGSCLFSVLKEDECRAGGLK